MANRKKTSPNKDEITFGELVLTGVSHTKAAAQVWPELKNPAPKGSRVFKKASFQQWYCARRELSYQSIREITAQHKADYESRINALAEAFGDPETNWREKLQIHDKLTAAEGRKVAAKPKGIALDTNRLAQLVAGAAALGATAGSSVPDGRLPAVHPALSQDTHEGARDTTVCALATPGTDVAGPCGPDSTQ